MKFRLVDGVLQRNLVSPSSLQDLQDQPSHEQVIPTTEQAPSVEQLQLESSSAPAVPEETTPAQDTVTTLSPVHIQEEPISISLPETQTQVLMETPI